MQTTRPAQLVLEDGTVFAGSAVGAPGVAAGEACFTTAMAGYEEAASDPSYTAQVLAFSYPLVGNYGVDPGRLESDGVYAEAIVMRRARPARAPSSSATVPAIRQCSLGRSKRSATCSGRSQYSVSASATRSWGSRSGWRRSSSPSGTAARTTRFAT